MTVARRVASRIDLPVLAIVAVAAAVRFVRLDLMEFKFDEAEACRLALHVLGYSEPGVGSFFPTEGLQASVAVPNPPLFVYLVAVPLAVVRSPLAAAAAIAAANVFAVWLCAVAGTRIYSRFVGLVAAALFAVAPWCVVFSRKIWAQDVLPLTGTLFLLELHALVVARKERAAATLLLLLAAATQLHFSALVLAALVLPAFVAAREVVSRRAVALGLGGAVLLYLPFLVAHGGALLHGNAHSASTPPDLPHRFASTVHLTAAVSSADELSGLVGSSFRLAEPVGLVLGAIAFAGLVLACAGARAGPRRRLRALILVWYVLPAALLTVLPLSAYIHYFIVLLPLPFLGIAVALEALRPRLATAAVAAVCLYFALVDVRLYRIVADHGGAPGDYGVAYRFKKTLVDEAVDATPGARVSFGATGIGAGSEYRFLAWNDDPGLRAGVARRYIVFDTLAGEHPPRPGRTALRAGPLVATAQRAQRAPR